MKSSGKLSTLLCLCLVAIAFSADGNLQLPLLSDGKNEKTFF